MDTETIDRLFLELSQVTRATTRKELDLANEINRLNMANASLRHENAILREALPTEDEWLDGELALSVYEETTQTSRKPGWNWALRVRSVLARLDSARKGG